MLILPPVQKERKPQRWRDAAMAQNGMLIFPDCILASDEVITPRTGVLLIPTSTQIDLRHAHNVEQRLIGEFD